MYTASVSFTRTLPNGTTRVSSVTLEVLVNEAKWVVEHVLYKSVR